VKETKSEEDAGNMMR